MRCLLQFYNIYSAWSSKRLYIWFLTIACIAQVYTERIIYFNIKEISYDRIFNYYPLDKCNLGHLNFFFK